MKKLAVTLFALSLTALGCGSDSGTTTPTDAAKDLQPGTEVQPDVPVTGPEAGPETQADKPVVEVQTPDVAVDKPAVDTGSVDQAPLDVPTQLDGGSVDVPAVDGGSVDGKSPDLRPAVDTAKVDAGTNG